MQGIYKGTDIDTEADLSVIAYVYFKYNFFAFNGRYFWSYLFINFVFLAVSVLH